MSKKIQAIRGMNDLLPADSQIWSFLDSTINNLLLSYGYKYCRTPNVESTETFSRAIGEVTDIVEKEMYTWKDNNGDSLTLRPEGTAGVVRMMIEHNLPREGIQKVFYSGPMFRHERPKREDIVNFTRSVLKFLERRTPKLMLNSFLSLTSFGNH